MIRRILERVIDSTIGWLRGRATALEAGMHFRTYIVKRCKCGEQYTARRFLRLHPPVAGGEMSDGYGGVLFLRNCLCNSTLAVLRTALTSRQS